MALFQKKPQINTSVPLYTTGLGDNRYLIIGLGNPDEKYSGTRHNIGFDCVDAFIQEHGFPGWTAKKDLHAQFSSTQLASSHIIAIKPNTYMNKSGIAVQATAQFYKIAPANIVVVYDDMDIMFGQIRSQVGGSSAGHNGIRSIIDTIGPEFGRIRIGIGSDNKPADSSNYVLGKFGDNEKNKLPDIKNEAIAMVTEYIFSQTKLNKETRTVF